MGVAMAKAHIALIASMGISGGTSAASAAKAGHASEVNARTMITNAIFFCVFSPPFSSGLGLAAVGRKEKGVFGFQAFRLEHFIPVS